MDRGPRDRRTLGSSVLPALQAVARHPNHPAQRPTPARRTPNQHRRPRLAGPSGPGADRLERRPVLPGRAAAQDRVGVGVEYSGLQDRSGRRHVDMDSDPAGSPPWECLYSATKSTRSPVNTRRNRRREVRTNVRPIGGPLACRPESTARAGASRLGRSPRRASGTSVHHARPPPYTTHRSDRQHDEFAYRRSVL